jgi:hypothetical protein
MHVLVVRGTVKSGEAAEFLAAAQDYNAARVAAGVPAYRHLLRTDDGGEEYVFVAEFDDDAGIDHAEGLIDAGTFSEPLARMYRHLVADSVTVARLRDV